MSQSPTEAGEATKEYVEGWGAVYALMRQGLSWSGHERHNAFLNLGGGRFADVSAVAGIDLDDDGRGLALVDWDQDGALDFWASNRTGPALRFFRNRALSGGSSVSLRLRGTSVNRDAVGARVELLPAGRERPGLVRMVTAGDGFLSQSTKWLHFGLGEARGIESALVTWPGGERETFVGLEPGGRFLLVEGRGEAEALARVALDLPRSAAAPEPPVPGRSGRTLLAARFPLSGLEFLDPSGRKQAVATGSGRPALVNLWASWCENCRHELAEMARQARRLRRSDVDVYALSVDEEADRAKATAFLEELDWPFASGFAEPDLVDVLDIVQQMLHDIGGGMVLPTSFLFDGEGRLAALYRGPVGVDRLLSDLAVPAGTPEEIRASATPFSGRWLTPPGGRPLQELANHLRSHGHTELAASYLLDLELSENAPRWARVKWAEDQGQLGRDLAAAGRHEEAVAAFRKGLEVEADRMDLHNEAGRSLFSLGRFDEAQWHFSQAIRIQPGDAGAHLNLGLALVNQQQVEEGAREFQAALDLAGAEAETGAMARFNLAVYHGESGRTEQAFALVEEALELDPGYGEAWRYLGVLEERSGRVDAAIAAFERALELDATDAFTALLLGRSYLRARDLEGAKRQLATLRALGHPAAAELESGIARLGG